jgi:formylglycine-generating enzyme required for sulfatase activity
MPTPRTIRTPLLLQCIVLLLACLLSPQHAQAAPDKRVALLIGNARYTSGLPPLSNPPKDTAALEASLKKLNFSVQRITDGDQKAMGRAIKQFGTDAQDAQVAFFYYSGHGMQARDENYLIPIAAQIETEAELDGEAINLRGVLRQIEDARPQNAVIVLDACRDNPVAGRSKNASKGLSRVQSQPTNTLVVFAAQAGTTASDNGVFAKALASHITQPNVGVRVVFDNVGKAVRSASGNKQSIQRDDQLSEDIVLLASVGGVPNPNLTLNPTPTPLPLPANTDPETALWNEVKASGSLEYYEAYLQQYPKGKYVALARLEIKKLAEQAKAQQQQREQTAWDQAKATNTAQAFEAFASQHPAGQYAVLAKAAIARLQREEAEAARLKREQDEREAREMRPGKVFKDCAECPDMVVIPAGSFTMGSNVGAAQEKPPRRVNIRSFALGKFEVTQGQWKAVMGSNPSNFSNCGDNCPVEQVSWDDIQQYIQRLNQQTGKQYRLPSESEWEYAARAGSTGKWSFGDNESVLGQHAWYDANSINRTWPVGQKQANAFGLHDMHGNVWEWVQDVWHYNYTGAPTDGSAWTAGGEESGRVRRGGSWYNYPHILRLAVRDWNSTVSRADITGVRIARTVP